MKRTNWISGLVLNFVPLTCAISAAPLCAYVYQVKIIFQECLTVGTPQVHFSLKGNVRTERKSCTSLLQNYSVFAQCVWWTLRSKQGRFTCDHTKLAKWVQTWFEHCCFSEAVVIYDWTCNLPFLKQIIIALCYDYSDKNEIISTS